MTVPISVWPPKPTVASPVTSMQRAFTIVTRKWLTVSLSAHVEASARVDATVVWALSVNVVTRAQTSSTWSVRSVFSLILSKLLVFLQTYYGRFYNLCVYSCTNGDLVCNGNCFREYTANLEQCPCRSGCPNGCPGDVYECPETTDVLVLNTQSLSNVPIITNALGREDSDFVFDFGEGTEAYGSCSLTWQNEHFVFGGTNNKTQISKIVGC